MQTNNKPLSKLLNEKDVARTTGMSLASVRRWKVLNDGPRSSRSTLPYDTDRKI
jgi:hypothetical protein